MILCSKCCSHSLIVRFAFAMGLVHPLDVGVTNIGDKVRDPIFLLFISSAFQNGIFFFYEQNKIINKEKWGAEWPQSIKGIYKGTSKW